jgi:penicillin amidase
VRIARDDFGIPHISADHDADAWLALGFCQAQDRAFQLELLRRVVSGTLAELVGPEGLRIDRLARRIGFRAAAERQLPALDPDVRSTIEAFAAGVNAGMRLGLRRRVHELALLRAQPGRYGAADVLAQLALQSFLLASNWDVELARLRILHADGVAALLALDPACAHAADSNDGFGAGSDGALRRLADDASALQAQLGHGGGSNSWALGPARTASGRPLLANDPHLPPVLPSQWYLAHLTCPDWAVAGACLAGGPAIASGHNGHVAWGITAGVADNTDLFIERVLDGGRTVAGPNGPEPCELRVEQIAVRGRGIVEEEVLVTPRGPVIGPALDGESEAISLAATWLQPRPVRGLIGARREQTVAEFQRSLKTWPGPSLVVVAADSYGAIAWRLIGELPRRRAGNGTLPMAAWNMGAGWEREPVAAAEMPLLRDPPESFVVSANNAAPTSQDGPFLGVDWYDDYRAKRIAQALAARADWTIEATRELQLDVITLCWDELREPVLRAMDGADDLAPAAQLLSNWDASLSAGSTAASVYELFLAEMMRRAVAARAPSSADWALGRSATPLAPYQAFAARRAAHLARLLRTQPEGWFDGSSWAEQIAESLRTALAELGRDHGADPKRWSWGDVRPIVLRHPLGEKQLLARTFNRGPLSGAGDATTIAQGAPPPAEPTANPLFVPTLRTSIDVGQWDTCRFVLLGGQSGNPFSPHYDDMVPLWTRGEGVPIAWSAANVTRATRLTIHLVAPDGS